MSECENDTDPESRHSSHLDTENNHNKRATILQIDQGKTAERKRSSKYLDKAAPSIVSYLLQSTVAKIDWTSMIYSYKDSAVVAEVRLNESCRVKHVILVRPAELQSAKRPDDADQHLKQIE